MAIIPTNGEFSKVPDGSELPAATSSDEGKVLTVNSSGDPAWVTPSGLFIVNANGFSGGNVLDKTYAEIISAISTGKVPLVAYDGGFYSMAHISFTSPDVYMVGVWNRNSYVLFKSTTETGVLTADR